MEDIVLDLQVKLDDRVFEFRTVQVLLILWSICLTIFIVYNYFTLNVIDNKIINVANKEFEHNSNLENQYKTIINKLSYKIDIQNKQIENLSSSIIELQSKFDHYRYSIEEKKKDIVINVPVKKFHKRKK